MRIFMDTTQVEMVARTLRDVAARIDQNIARLRQEMQTLNAVWYGPSVDEYLSQQGALLQRMQRYPIRLQELAGRLDAEVQEYIIISSHLG